MDQFFETFFSWVHFKGSFSTVVEGFKTNLSLMFVAEACVLVWGLVLALVRLGSGRLTQPLRWLTIGYIDLFRAVPGLVLIYMVGFGIPIADVPALITDRSIRDAKSIIGLLLARSRLERVP